MSLIVGDRWNRPYKGFTKKSAFHRTHMTRGKLAPLGREESNTSSAPRGHCETCVAYPTSHRGRDRP